MKKPKRRHSLVWLVIMALVLLGACAAIATAEGTSTPWVLNDKTDYRPGELVTLTGGNWQPDTNVSIAVNDDVGQSWRLDTTAVVNADGGFSASFNLPSWFVASYTVVVTGANGDTATTSFTDAQIDYSQGANGKGGTGVIEWINGNINAQKALYYEGMSSPQRIIGTGMTGTSHRFVFALKWTQQGAHGYDFITGSKFTGDEEAGVKVVYPATSSGFSQPAKEALLIPLTPIIYHAATTPPPDWQYYQAGQAQTAATNCWNGYHAQVLVSPDDSYVSKDGDTLPKIKQYEKDFGNRAIDLYSTAPMSNVQLTFSHDVADKQDTDSSWVVYTLTWNSPSGWNPDNGGALDSMVDFGAHLAVGLGDQGSDIGWGPGTGAASINGSPYHVRVDYVDDSQGNRDNQIATDAVMVHSRITGIKFNDPDADGYTPGDTLLDHWVIYADLNDNNLLDKDSSGKPTEPFSVTGETGLPQGTYSLDFLMSASDQSKSITVREELLDPAWEQTWPKTTQMEYVVSVAPGQLYDHRDFGNRIAPADLSINKEDVKEGDPTVNLTEPVKVSTVNGQQFDYFITVTNNSSTATAKNVVVNDVIDEQETLINVKGVNDPTVTPSTKSWSWGWDSSLRQLTFSLNDMAPGEVVTIEFTVEAMGTAPQSGLYGGDPTPPSVHQFNPVTGLPPARQSWVDGQVTNDNPDLFNYCWVTSDTPDPAKGNNGSWQPTSVEALGAGASIAIDKVTIDAGTPDNVGDGIKVLAGDSIKWRYTVTNPGELALSTVTVSDGDLTLTKVSNGDGDAYLAHNESWVYEASGTAIHGTYKNTGTASGSGTDIYGDPHDAGPVTDTSSYTGVTPKIAIDKVTIDAGTPDNVGDGIKVLAGDTLVWKFTVTNTGDEPLSHVAISDDKLGTITNLVSGDTNGDGKLDKTETWVYTATGPAAHDTVSNEATASGDWTDAAGHKGTTSAKDTSSYTGVTPKIAIDKVTNGSDTNILLLGTALTWTYTVTNTGDEPLSHIAVTDNRTGVTPTYVSGDRNTDGKLDLTETWIYEAYGTAKTSMLTSYGNPYTNTGKAYGDWTDQAGHKGTTEATNDSQFTAYGLLNVLKLTNGVLDPYQNWTFELWSGDRSKKLEGPINVNGDSDGLIEFQTKLDPLQKYWVIETNVPAGWTSVWYFNGVIVNAFNMDSLLTPPQSLGNVGMQVGYGTDFTIPDTGTLYFKIDNTYPGGEPRTPGYWKNWCSVGGGGQMMTAFKNGGWQKGYWTLDDLLQKPGFDVGLMHLDGTWDNDVYKYPNATINLNTGQSWANDCVEARLILDKSDVVSDKKGNYKKMSSDAAYELACNLFCAKLNIAAGAEQGTKINNLITAAQLLLSTAPVNFTGTGGYLPSTVKGSLATVRTNALKMAADLDLYNNGKMY
jgi:uncharacterized repeat protein (TIGR01451 family)